MKTAAFTIVAKNYLPFARVLMNSLRAVEPDVVRIIVLVDRIDGYFDPVREDCHFLLSEDLGIPASRWVHFKYTILELSTAVKPYAANYIFDHFDIDRLLYFDPDIKFFGPLSGLFTSLDQYSIILTPHLTASVEDDRHPTELDILRSGSYNLGFIGLRRTEETRRFLRWWERRLYDQCVVDLPKGLFVDQRWIDLVPGMFDGVGVLRDAGYNVAYWNIAQRKVERSDCGFLVNGNPLCFFHFSGFDPENPRAFSKHQDRFTRDDLGDASEIVMEYSRLLLENGFSECKKWPYAYGYFDNGLVIPDMGRAAHRESPEFPRHIADPFTAKGYDAFIAVWNTALSAGGRSTGITRLAYRIYKAREDVQAAMPDIFNADRLRFLHWCLSSGRVEHKLGDEYLAPIWEALRREKAESFAAPSSAVDSIVNERIVAAAANSGSWSVEATAITVESLNEMVTEDDGRLTLSKLARMIYASRPDLKARFPDPSGKDGASFLLWFLTYGVHEYRLAEVLVAPLRGQWRGALRSIGSPIDRLWYRVALRASAGSMLLRERLSTLHFDLRMAHASNRASRPSWVPGKGSRGVNFIGYVKSEMGVGESVRCAIRAARSCNLPITVKSVDSIGPYRLQDHSIAVGEGGSPHLVNVFHVNADQSNAIMAKLGPSATDGKYNIGYWAWELEEFPDKWSSAFRQFNEIWTPSGFCQTSIARKSPVPVVRIPHAIHIEKITEVSRDSISVESGEFVFLGIFDLLSVLERKNPIGMLKAFRLAFAGAPGYRLVLKINHGSEKPAEMDRIRRAADGLPVTIIDQTMDRDRVNGLIQMADCLVSLHRSEGFGLTIAEAMYLGKPVITTAYSGNMDFTTPANSFLVDYDLVNVPEGCEPYDPASRWAEPRLEHAAELMQLVANDQSENARRSIAARTEIRERFSPEAIGRLMVERLESQPFRLLNHQTQKPV